MTAKRIKWKNPTQDETGKKLKQYTQWSGMKCRATNFSVAEIYYKVGITNLMSDYDLYLEWAMDQKGWMNTEYDNRIWAIDKDIVGNGLLYSEDVCVFVPMILNSFNTDVPTGVFSKGVNLTYNNRYAVRVREFGKRIAIGTYDTEAEAIQFYQTRRISYLDKLWTMYEGKVDDRVLHNMLVKLTNSFTVPDIPLIQNQTTCFFA